MSRAGARGSLRSHVQRGLGDLYSEFQCIMGNVTCHPHCGQNEGQIRLKTLPSRNFVDGRQKCDVHRVGV